MRWLKNREIRLEQQFLRLIDPRIDDGGCLQSDDWCLWGNCWEWTLSTDASGSYIVKGGSWDSERDDYRSEKSDVVRTGTQGYVNVGFRVVRVEP